MYKPLARIKTNRIVLGHLLRQNEQRDPLLLGHLPQVRFIARRIHCRLPPQVLLDDLIHAGVLGLIDAIKKYDPGKKVQLKHYAEFRIRGAIFDSLRQVDWSPRTLRTQARKLDKTVRDCRAQLGREPTEPEIAVALKMTLVRLRHLRGDLRGLDLTNLQVDADQLGSDGEAPARPGGEEQDPYHQTLRSEMQGLLTGAVNQLPLREQEVLAPYDFGELSMEEVAKALGMESRACRKFIPAQCSTFGPVCLNVCAGTRVWLTLQSFLRTWNRTFRANPSCDAKKTSLLQFIDNDETLMALQNLP